MFDMVSNIFEFILHIRHSCFDSGFLGYGAARIYIFSTYRVLAGMVDICASTSLVMPPFALLLGRATNWFQCYTAVLAWSLFLPWAYQWIRRWRSEIFPCLRLPGWTRSLATMAHFHDVCGGTHVLLAKYSFFWGPSILSELGCSLLQKT